MISFGAVLGKASRLQLILMGIFEVVFFAFNETVLVHYLVVSDVGGSLVIHLFGCYFGLAVAFVLKRQSTTGEENSKEGPSTTSDMFSLIGNNDSLFVSQQIVYFVDYLLVRFSVDFCSCIQSGVENS